MIRLAASDSLSGVNGVQFANQRAKPFAVRPYAARVRHLGKIVPRLVRVRDHAGNFSPWRVVVGARDLIAPRVSALRVSRSGSYLRLAMRLSESATLSGHLSTSSAGKPVTHPIRPTRLGAGARILRIGGVSAGSHRLRLVLRDAAGNRRVVSRAIRVP
jgi:hypothetical protein